MQCDATFCICVWRMHVWCWSVLQCCLVASVTTSIASAICCNSCCVMLLWPRGEERAYSRIVMWIWLSCRVHTSNEEGELSSEFIFCACPIKFQGNNSEAKCVHALSLMEPSICKLKIRHWGNLMRKLQSYGWWSWLAFTQSWHQPHHQVVGK